MEKMWKLVSVFEAEWLYKKDIGCEQSDCDFTSIKHSAWWATTELRYDRTHKYIYSQHEILQNRLNFTKIQ
jgi:hypothetical protein